MNTTDKISSTKVSALLKREYKIKITGRELNLRAESFGMFKEHRINNLGGAMAYYWSPENIEKLKKELL